MTRTSNNDMNNDSGTAVMNNNYLSISGDNNNATIENNKLYNKLFSSYWFQLLVQGKWRGDDDTQCAPTETSPLLNKHNTAPVSCPASPQVSDCGTENDDECSSTMTSIQLITLCAVCVLSGVGNNITFVMMGNAMQDYPLFLLYGTTAIYGVIYLLWLRYRAYGMAQQQKKQEQSDDDSYPAAANDSPRQADNSSQSRDNDCAFVVLGKSHDNSVCIDVLSNDAEANQARAACSLSSNAIMYKGSSVGLWAHYLGIGMLVTASGVLAQFADTRVSGSYQSLLNQMTLPLTAIFAKLALRHNYSRMEQIGAIVVAVASSLPLVIGTNDVDQETDHELFWILMFALSEIPSSIVAVWEQHVFTNYEMDEIHYLACTNIITLVGYLVAIPIGTLPRFGSLSWDNLWNNQVLAVSCFVGASPLPPGCQPNAYLPVLSFVFSVVLYYYALTVLCKQQSATFQVLVNAMVTPLSAVAFSSPYIMGLNAQPLSTITLAACGLIPVGIIIYKWESIYGTSTNDSETDDCSVSASCDHA